MSVDCFLQKVKVLFEKCGRGRRGTGERITHEFLCNDIIP